MAAEVLATESGIWQDPDWASVADLKKAITLSDGRSLSVDELPEGPNEEMVRLLSMEAAAAAPERDILIQQEPTRRSVQHLPKALEGISEIPLPGPDNRSLKVELSEDDSWKVAEMGLDNAGVVWSLDPGQRVCEMVSAFMLDLPRWVQIGKKEAWIDPERGIPTMQAIKAMLFNELKLEGRVDTVNISSVNPQTQVDVMHGMLVERLSLKEASARSQSAYLVAELGQMLGAEVYLSKAEPCSREVKVTEKTFVKELYYQILPAGQKEKFLQQEKIQRILDELRSQEPFPFYKMVDMQFTVEPTNRGS